MSTLENVFMFTLRFKAPAVIKYLDIKGNSTYKIDLSFRDQNEKYIC